MPGQRSRKRKSAFLKGMCGLVFFFLFAGFSIPEENYPLDYFTFPLNRPVQLSGTFGELRTNHFHAGVDIKSKDGTTGEPLIAAGPGYISKIGIQGSGYGNVLYIDHPNGYTTVYGHLDGFPEEVAAYIKSMQYLQERFAVELFPAPHLFPVQKGQLIGYMGNTGSSTGPHVHFEIRKTSDQLPINPLLFGLKVTDLEFPGIRSLKVYHLDDALRDTEDKEYLVTRISEGKYQLTDTLLHAASKVGFALKVYDKMAGASNQNGIYSLTLSVDDVPQYRFALDEIPFSLTRYLNAHIDFAAKKWQGAYFHRCFRLPGNALDIYDENAERGVVALSEDKPRKVEITAYDHAGNGSSLVFYIRSSPLAPTMPDPAYEHQVDYLQSTRLNQPDFLVSFEPHTFYQNVRLNISEAETPSRRKFYGDVHTISPSDIPVHRYFDLSVLCTGIPEHHRNKAFLARISEGGGIINCGGVLQGNYMSGRVRSLGSYTVSADTLVPEIVPIYFRENMKGMSKMQFRIGDGQAIEGEASALKFEGRVDGKWILFEHDAKTSKITHTFDERITPGKHEFILKVTDDRGNVSSFVRTFSR